MKISIIKAVEIAKISTKRASKKLGRSGASKLPPQAAQILKKGYAVVRTDSHAFIAALDINLFTGKVFMVAIR